MEPKGSSLEVRWGAANLIGACTTVSVTAGAVEAHHQASTYPVLEERS
jgi:hypothetical protein